MSRIVRIPSQLVDLHYIAHGLNLLRRGRMQESNNIPLLKNWERMEQIICAVVPEAMPRKERGPWSILGKLAGDQKLDPRPSLRNGRAIFNWWAGQYPVQLSLTLEKDSKGRTVLKPVLVAHRPASSADCMHLRILWETFLGKQGYERLKPCRKCGMWFVDRSRNKRRAFCTEKCANRWWDRKERRAADHDQYRTRRKSRTTRASKRIRMPA